LAGRQYYCFVKANNNCTMKTIRVLLGILLFALVALPETSCKKEGGISRLTVYLTDAPAEYDAIFIEVAGLQVKASADDGEGGWRDMPLPSTPATYNLLEFRNGMETLLSSVELPAGKVSQLRLILSDNSKIVVNGVAAPLPLVVPSGSESGLKFNIHADLIAGIEYKLWIDFDCAGSVVENGNGDHILKPLIHTFTEATSGAIKGMVTPTEADATVIATNGVESRMAIPDALTGAFLIRGVPPGPWTVTIDANNNYIDKIVPNVSVTIGQVTDVGSVVLTQ
jgi:hypothetical protein